MNKELKVGIFFTLSGIIFIFTIFYVGNFQETLSYQIRFAQVKGLEVDSPVHFNGVPIGRVTKITLSEEPSANNRVEINVQIGLHKTVKNHMRKSTTADIKNLGVLGDKYILLVTTDYEAEALEEDDFIRPMPNLLNVEELLKQGTDLVGDVTDITQNLAKILDQFANEDGLLQRMIGDQELADTTSGTLVEIFEKIKNKDSVMGLLLADPEFKENVELKLNVALANVNTLLETAQNDDNFLNLIIKDKTFKEEFRSQLFQVTNSAQEMVNHYKDAEGLIPILMKDKQYGENVAENIERATFHLANILEKIDKGEGSAGLIINDPAIYQGIHEVVYGLKNSGLSSWYIRSKQKKGQKLMDKDKDQTGGNP